MKHLKQYQPLVIEEFSADSFHYPRHHQNYYELIYICEGRGISQINATQLPYQAGDLCFISPQDNHYFEIQEHTTFIFIKFTNEYLKNIQNIHFPWQLHVFDPLALFSDSYLKEQRLQWTPSEMEQLKNSFQSILQEKDSGLGTNSLVIYFQLLVVLSKIYEHLKSIRTSQFLHENYNSLLINFIHQHIYDPEQLKIARIAAQIPISAQYFSAWFKQTYQIGYKEYIDRYRIELLKNRLAYSKATLQLLANEFGFTDSSHLSNYFYRHTQTRPLSYRKKMLKMENPLHSH